MIKAVATAPGKPTKHTPLTTAEKDKRTVEEAKQLADKPMERAFLR